MIDTEFDFDVCCRGVSWDKQDCVDDDGHNMVRWYYRIDTLMLRASPVMLDEWWGSQCMMYQSDFDTYEQYEAYEAKKTAKRDAWEAKVCEMLGWEPKHVCITNHMSEIFAVSKIERVEAEEYGG